MPPTIDTDFLARQRPAQISMALEPAPNVLNSLILLNAIDKLSGLGDWIERTAARLSPARKSGPSCLTGRRSRAGRSATARRRTASKTGRSSGGR